MDVFPPVLICPEFWAFGDTCRRLWLSDSYLYFPLSPCKHQIRKFIVCKWSSLLRFPSFCLQSSHWFLIVNECIPQSVSVLNLCGLQPASAHPNASVYSHPSTLYIKFPFTPEVCVETCESLSGSLASLAPSDHSDSPQFVTQTLEQINSLTGVRHEESRCMLLCRCPCACVISHPPDQTVTVSDL